MSDLIELGPGSPSRRPFWRLRIRLTLLSLVIGLLAAALGLTALVALVRNRQAAQELIDAQIVSSAIEAGHQVYRLLQPAAPALDRLAALSEQGVLPVDDPDRLATYLVADLEANPDIAWVSYSARATGSFIGATRRDGRTILNRAIDGGIPEEFEVQPGGVLNPVAAANPKPYDPRVSDWFRLALQSDAVRWTDPYRFAEGVFGITATKRLRTSPNGPPVGVATVDFALGQLDRKIAEMPVGAAGRAILAAPTSSGDVILIGQGAQPLSDDLRLAIENGFAEAVSERGLTADAQPIRIAIATADGDILAAFAPVAIGARATWYVAALVPAAEIEKPIRNATIAILATALGFLVLGTAGAGWLASRIARPIRAISDDLAEIADMNVSRVPAPRSFVHEIDSMGQAVDRMKAGLRSFSFYVPTALVREVLASGYEARLGGEMRDLTIMMADVASFTSISETLDTSAVVFELGDYLRMFDEAISAEGGTIDKFMGDGVLAFFNAPIPLEDHPARACAAADAAQRSMADLRRMQAMSGRPQFHVRIGLAAGSVLVGNIGTPDRFAYTVLGDVVNLASRLEALNKVYGTSVIGTARLRDEAAGGFEWRTLDRVAVAGRAGAVDICELMGMSGTVSDDRLHARDRYELGLDAYLAGDFERANVQFLQAQDFLPSDKAIIQMLSRVNDLRMAGIGAGWTGVHVYAEK